MKVAVKCCFVIIGLLIAIVAAQLLPARHLHLLESNLQLMADITVQAHKLSVRWVGGWGDFNKNSRWRDMRHGNKLR